MTKYLLSVCAAACALAGCSDEPDVVVVEPVSEEAVSSYENEPSEAALWDANDSGLLEEEEYLLFSSDAFSNWDNDRDGTLTPEEFTRHWTAAGFSQPAEAFRVLNSDDSEVLRQKDVFNLEQWERWDSDSSGVLEENEFPFY